MLPVLAALLAVHLNLEFDRSITSADLKRIAREEAAAIWRDYDVELLWTDEAEPALCLDVLVERNHQHVDAYGVPVVLAHTTIAGDLAIHAPIHISLDAVDALLDTAPVEAIFTRERAVATILGRVLAHELGHVLLGVPGYHDRDGLMRAKIPTQDLVRLERSRFRLSDHSAARLRARIAAFAAGQQPETCGRATASEGH
jgi:hypothetical protein